MMEPEAKIDASEALESPVPGKEGAKEGMELGLDQMSVEQSRISEMKDVHVFENLASSIINEDREVEVELESIKGRASGVLKDDEAQESSAPVGETNQIDEELRIGEMQDLPGSDNSKSSIIDEEREEGEVEAEVIKENAPCVRKDESSSSEDDDDGDDDSEEDDPGETMEDSEPLYSSAKETEVSSSDGDDDEDWKSSLQEHLAAQSMEKKPHNDSSDDEDDGKPPKTKNEVSALPPVPKVEVQLEPHQELLPIGMISSVVGLMIIVEGDENHQALDEGSILWLADSRVALGFVDEVFGPVKKPFYVVRHNDATEIPAEAQESARVAFVAEFAKTVLKNDDLFKRGYDASGLNDEELSDNEVEFSDDEKEAEFKRQKARVKRTMQHGREDFRRRPWARDKSRNTCNEDLSGPESASHSGDEEMARDDEREVWPTLTSFKTLESVRQERETVDDDKRDDGNVGLQRLAIDTRSKSDHGFPDRWNHGRGHDGRKIQHEVRGKRHFLRQSDMRNQHRRQGNRNQQRNQNQPHEQQHWNYHQTGARPHQGLEDAAMAYHPPSFPGYWPGQSRLPYQAPPYNQNPGLTMPQSFPYEVGRPMLQQVPPGMYYPVLGNGNYPNQQSCFIPSQQPGFMPVPGLVPGPGPGWWQPMNRPLQCVQPMSYTDPTQTQGAKEDMSQGNFGSSH